MIIKYLLYKCIKNFLKQKNKFRKWKNKANCLKIPINKQHNNIAMLFYYLKIILIK